MTKIALGSLLVGLLVSVSIVFAGEVYGVEATNPGKIRQEIKEERKDLRNDLQNLKKEIISKFVRVTEGTVTAVGTDSLTIKTKDNKTVTVNVTSKTKLRRRFWGEAKLTEISVGDLVNIWGSWTDSNQTAINATLVRDLSIQKKNGVFIGRVQSISGNTVVLNTVNRGVQTVTLSATAKYVNRKEQIMAQGDIKVGDRLRVRGMWDRKANTITEVSAVKDYSQPALKTGTNSNSTGSATTKQ